MSMVTLQVASREAVTQRALAAFEGKRQGAHISFETPELLWAVLTSKRWELLKVMAGAGPISLREAARRVGRDVKGVHGDAHALLDAGVIRRTARGKLEFPFDGVRVEFELAA